MGNILVVRACKVLLQSSKQLSQVLNECGNFFTYTEFLMNRKLLHALKKIHTTVPVFHAYPYKWKGGSADQPPLPTPITSMYICCCKFYYEIRSDS